jgi:hypothetical protein
LSQEYYNIAEKRINPDITLNEWYFLKE